MRKVYRPLEGVPMYLHSATMPAQSEWVPQIIVWEPVNLPSFGGACLVSLEDGSRLYIGRGSNRLLHLVCRYYNIDEQELRHKYRVYADRYQWVPIYIPVRKVVLFAVKTRIPDSHSEFASGYIANTAIKNMEMVTSNITRIYLSTGEVMEVYMSLQSVRARKHIAEMFAYLLRRDGIM